MNPVKSRKILFIRLSSLGDVILSTAALRGLSENEKADWVVAREFSNVLQNHPKVENLIAVDRKTLGFWGWVKILKNLSKLGYTDVYDLHRSLRSAFAFWVFKVFSPRTRWHSLSKQRIRSFLIIFFKGFLPKKMGPRPWVGMFANLAGSKTPQAYLPHLEESSNANTVKSLFLKFPQFQKNSEFLFLMPASQWKTKQWPVKKFASLAESLKTRIPVVLGTESDKASRKLTEELTKRGVSHLDLRSKLSLPETALLLSSLKDRGVFLGNDTGLFHLAEAMGMKSFSIMGPTSSSLGFGPSTLKGKEIGRNLACRPCSKSGKLCVRFWDSHACLKKLETAEVLAKIQ